MISIYGAGMAGTYLATHLKNNGIEHEIYDIHKKPDCRCAWGIMYKQARELMRSIGYSIDDYLLVKPNNIIFNDIRFKNKNIVTFSKLLWLNDLWKNLDIKKPETRYDTIRVDATGNARAIIGKPEQLDSYTLARCIQYRIISSDIDNNLYIYTNKGTGYAWAFPLSETEWHIGAGATNDDDIDSMFSTLLNKLGITKPDVSCMCPIDTYVSHTSFTKIPITDKANDIVAVGEAAGLTSAAGEGNIFAMSSAKILGDIIKHTSDLFDTPLIYEKYEKAIEHEFGWLDKQYEFVDAINKNNITRITRLAPYVAYHSYKRVSFGLEDIVKVVNSIVR